MPARPEQVSPQAARSDMVVQYVYVHDRSEQFDAFGVQWSRRLRDDGWIARLRLSQAARSRLGGAMRSRPEGSAG